MAESVELPGRLAILPFRNKVLLPGAIIRIRCTSSSRYFRFSCSICCWWAVYAVSGIWLGYWFMWMVVVLVWSWWNRNCGRGRRKDWSESCRSVMLRRSLHQPAPCRLQVINALSESEKARLFVLACVFVYWDDFCASTTFLFDRELFLYLV